MSDLPANPKPPSASLPILSGPPKAKDPVCGIMVDKDPDLSANHKGETYYFCSKADMDKFKKEPEKYVKKK